MTYINLTRHDARLGGDLRLRLAWHLQNVNTGSVLIIQHIKAIYYKKHFYVSVFNLIQAK